jgi:hypothetical protein
MNDYWVTVLEVTGHYCLFISAYSEDSAAATVGATSDRLAVLRVIPVGRTVENLEKKYVKPTD